MCVCTAQTLSLRYPPGHIRVFCRYTVVTNGNCTGHVCNRHDFCASHLPRMSMNMPTSKGAWRKIQILRTCYTILSCKPRFLAQWEVLHMSGIWGLRDNKLLEFPIRRLKDLDDFLASVIWYWRWHGCLQVWGIFSNIVLFFLLSLMRCVCLWLRAPFDCLMCGRKVSKMHLLQGCARQCVASKTPCPPLQIKVHILATLLTEGSSDSC